MPLLAWFTISSYIERRNWWLFPSGLWVTLTHSVVQPDEGFLKSFQIMLLDSQQWGLCPIILQGGYNLLNEVVKSCRFFQLKIYTYSPTELTEYLFYSISLLTMLPLVRPITMAVLFVLLTLVFSVSMTGNKSTICSLVPADKHMLPSLLVFEVYLCRPIFVRHG